jgi:VWFA-related protein
MKSRRTVTLFLAVLLAAAGAGGPSALGQNKKTAQDDDEEVVAVTTELIDVRAVVTDKRGRVVERLTKDDFELTEGGVPQQLAFFSEERIVAGARAVEERSNSRTDVALGDSSAAAGLVTPTRTILFFVDTPRLSLSSVARVKRALLRFVDEQMSDGDLVAIATPTGRLGLLSQFTQDRRVLRGAIEKLGYENASWPTLLSPYLAAQVLRRQSDAINLASRIIHAEEGTPDKGYSGEAQGAIADLDDALVRHRAQAVLGEESAHRQSLLRALGSGAEQLARTPGQRLLTIFSEGFTTLDNSGTLDAVQLRAVVSRAARTGVVVNAVSAQGLEAGPVARADLPTGFNPGGDYQRYDSISKSELLNGLNALADGTGGKLFLNENDLSRAVQRTLDENQTYYRMAYYPPGGPKGNVFREVSLRVKNYPDYVVRAQKGYQLLDAATPARKTTPIETLFATLVDPLPRKELEVSISADFLERPADEAQITLNVDISAASLARDSADGQPHRLELAIGFYGSNGKPSGVSYDTLDANVSAGDSEVARLNGYRYTKRVSLKPGTYQIRVGVRDKGTNRVGTSSVFVEVPDTGRGRLALSSLVVSQSSGGKLSRPPAVNGLRRYVGADALVYYLRVYNAEANGRSGDGLFIKTELSRGGTLVSQTAWELVAPYVSGSDRMGLELAGSLRFGETAGGVYTLRVLIKSSGSNRMAEQSTTFAVTGTR